MCSNCTLMLAAEKFGFDPLDPFAALHWYIGPVVNMSTMSQIQRGNYTTDLGMMQMSLYDPPPLELYTIFSKKIYFIIFWALHLAQIMIIFFVNKLWSKSMKDTSIWETFLFSVGQSHFPFPYEDWDAKKGNCSDHITRQKAAQKEVLVLTIINLTFNLLLLSPLVILCKIIFETNDLFIE